MTTKPDPDRLELRYVSLNQAQEPNREDPMEDFLRQGVELAKKRNS